MKPMEMAWTLLKMQKAWYDEEHPLGQGPGEEGHDPKAPENIMPSEEDMHYTPMDDSEEDMMDQIHSMHDDPEMGDMAWQNWVHQNTERGEFQPEMDSERDDSQGFSTAPSKPVGVRDMLSRLGSPDSSRKF